MINKFIRVSPIGIERFREVFHGQARRKIRRIGGQARIGGGRKGASGMALSQRRFPVSALISATNIIS